MKKKYNSQFEKMTAAPVDSLLFSLALPSILSMTVTNIYNLADTAFVGTLGTSQSGATGIVFSFMSILQAVAFMCGQGAGSIMSRKLGEQDVVTASRYTSSGFFMSFFLGFLIAVLSFAFFTPFIYFLGSTDTIAPYAKQYVFFILISAPFFTSSLTMNNLLRYEGKAKLGTIGLMIGAFLNIAGDAVLIFVLKLGITGAGISTAVSQFISWCILVSMFLRGKTQTKISFSLAVKDSGKNYRVYAEIAATGFPSLLRQGLNTVSTMLLNRAARVFGDEAVAAMSIVSRISFFPMSCAIGIGQGFQPISAFNYGAKKFSRVKKAFWCAMAGGVIILILTAIPLCIKPDFFIRLLRNDDAVVEIGRRALRFMAIAETVVPVTMMVEMGFQSTGKKLLASMSSSLRSGVIFIPVLVIFSRLRGLSGIQEAQPLSFLITALFSIVLIKTYLNGLSEKSSAS